jgi:hydroxyacyl-ACP dehydratase HTD2-like protein with hotdog domain
MTLLTPALLAHVGNKGPERHEIATRRDIRKYSVSTGQVLRKYLDGDVAPPLFHIHLFWEVVELEELAPDGVFIDTLIPQLPLEQAMAGGVELEYFSPIYAGDELVATRTLSDLYEKEGRTGHLIFSATVMDIRTKTGEPVLRETTTRLVR